MHNILTLMLSARRSYLCTVDASVPYAYFQGTQHEHLKNGKTYACDPYVYVQHAHQLLMHMLSGCSSS
jgi:hypothetical protein